MISVSNSTSISIFWLAKFRVRDRYQYFDGLSFEFDININILEPSVSKRYRCDIDILAIFPKSISISTSIRKISHRSALWIKLTSMISLGGETKVMSAAEQASVMVVLKCLIKLFPMMILDPSRLLAHGSITL